MIEGSKWCTLQRKRVATFTLESWKKRGRYWNIGFLTFLTFRRCLPVRVAGLEETFPSFSVSGPFILDVPGFQVPSDSIVPPNFGRPLGRFPTIFISATARMFSVSSLLLTCPNHSSLLRLITVAIASTFASSKISSFSGPF